MMRSDKWHFSAFIVTVVFSLLMILYSLNDPAMKIVFKKRRLSNTRSDNEIKDLHNLTKSKKKRMTLTELKRTAEVAMKTCLCSSQTNDEKSSSLYQYFT